DQSFARLTTVRLGPAHLEIGRRRRTRHPMRTAFPVGIHDSKIMLRVLVQVFGRYAVAASRCFARKGNIAFEDLIRAAADLYVWAVAVEGLSPLGHPRAVVVVRIVPIAAAAGSLVWSWSHDTCLVAGGHLSDRCPTGTHHDFLERLRARFARSRKHRRAPE